MSSKGPTVAGSDGSDFSHRQKVADHYKIRYLLYHLFIQTYFILRVLFKHYAINCDWHILQFINCFVGSYLYFTIISKNSILILVYKTKVALSIVFYFTIYYSFLWLQNYAQMFWTDWIYLY